jgi:hypothetical protein
MIRNSLNLEVLLHCYYSPNLLHNYDAPAVKDAVAYLRSCDMIKVKEETTDGRYIYDITEKGDFYIKYIFNVPFPDIKWEIPVV